MAKARGSASLRNFNKADIAALKSATSKAGYRIIDWRQRGMPPEPEGLSAIIHGDEGLGRLVDRLSAINSLRELRILIRGTPVPNFFEVQADLQNRIGF